MSVRNLDRLLDPKSIAVVGAGAEPGGLGHIVLRNLLDGGFGGEVHPITPAHEVIDGVPAHASVLDLPSPPDLAVVCVPAAAVPQVVHDCGEAGVPAVAVISAGFREAGAAGLELEQRVARELARHDGMRLLGPNCLGLIVPRISLNASFARTLPPDGQIAFVSQSGALATAVIDWAGAQRIGFSHVVSLGNTLDVDLGDLIDHLGADHRTRAIIVYVEAIKTARKFMSAARAFARNKPIVAHKSGRFAASAHAAVSHTGAMVGEDAVYDAAFRRAGVVRVQRIEDVFATAQLLARERPVSRGRIAIVTNAGGPGVMAADALLARDGELATLGEATLERLDAALPGAWSHGNPIDVLGDAPPRRFGDAVAAALDDDGVDGVLAILTPQAMTDALASAEAVIEARGAHDDVHGHKAVLGAWMGGASVRGGLERLTAAGIPTYPYPEQAIDAFMDLVSYARNVRTLYETPRAIPVSLAVDRDRARDLLAVGGAGPSGLLSELAAKRLLDAYGIAVTMPVEAAGPEEAVAAAREIGHPVVLKVASPDITHKTDVGGVELGLGDDDAVRAAFGRIVAAAREHVPGADVRGVTVQPMARADHGLELVLGARRDPGFGAVIMLGAGGVAAEVLGDRALDLPPLNERLADAMLRSLRIWPLLAGHRGRPGADLDALLKVVMRFSHLVADQPALSEIEINPLLAGPDGALALDARALVDAALAQSPPRPFSHLAIRPYPEEWTRAATTRGGLDVTLRAIRPEDEPMWHQMLDACSSETIHARFRAQVKHTHELAARFCFIDYDRELAIVAELGEEDDRRLAGVVRLVADPDRQSAEYAILVADPWQGLGLADLLTEHSLQIARKWGLRRVWAETLPDNLRLIAVLRSHGFAVTRRVREGVVVGERAP